MTEIFYPQDNSHESMLVTLQNTSMDLNTITVQRAGQQYQLHWNNSYSRYEGTVSGQRGYVL